MKNNKKKSKIQLFVLKKKTNNNGMINPISYCFYILPSVYVSAQKNLQLFMRQNEKISQEKEFIQSHPVRLDFHPIRSHGITISSKVYHGMGWDGIVPSHQEPSSINSAVVQYSTEGPMDTSLIQDLRTYGYYQSIGLEDLWVPL